MFKILARTIEPKKEQGIIIEILQVEVPTLARSFRKVPLKPNPVDEEDFTVTLVCDDAYAIEQVTKAFPDYHLQSYTIVPQNCSVVFTLVKVERLRTFAEQESGQEEHKESKEKPSKDEAEKVKQKLNI